MLTDWSPGVEVRIAGEPVFSRGLQVQESLREITRLSLVVETIAGRDPAPRLGDTVTVDLRVAGASRTFAGTVTQVRTERGGGDWTFYRVEARGQGELAKRYRVLGAWGRAQGEDADPVPAETIVVQAVQLAQAPINSSGVQPGAGSIAELDSPYDSLYDILEELADQTGWVWRLAHQASGDPVLEWFDPATNTAAELTQTDFGDGLQVNESLDSVKNVARAQAYEYRTESAAVPLQRGMCQHTVVAGTYIHRSEWEVAEKPHPVNDDLPDDLADVTAEPTGDGRLEFDRPISIPKHPCCTPRNTPSSLRLQWTVRRPLWVKRTAPASVAQYGWREATPLGGDDMSIKQAGAKLEALLKEKAWPPVEVSGTVNRGDLQPGQARPVTLTEPALSRTCIVESVTWSFTGARLQVEAALATPQVAGNSVNAASTDTTRRAAQAMPNPVTNVARRVERLERERMRSGALTGTQARSIGDVEAAPEVKALWAWSGLLQTERAEEIHVAGLWAWARAKDTQARSPLTRWAWRYAAQRTALAPVDSSGLWAWTDACRGDALRKSSVWAGAWTYEDPDAVPPVDPEEPQGLAVGSDMVLGSVPVPPVDPEEPQGLAVGSDMVLSVKLHKQPQGLAVGSEFSLGGTE